mgnify:CR=1 FL=1
MNRIPTEGLKPVGAPTGRELPGRLNEQNPDRGIETAWRCPGRSRSPSLNEQNPDRGIETGQCRRNE